jgi:hypothetical protein
MSSGQFIVDLLPGLSLSDPDVIQKDSIGSLPGADEEWCRDLLVGGFQGSGMRSVRSATAHLHRSDNKAVQWLPLINEGRRNGQHVNTEFCGILFHRFLSMHGITVQQ